MLNGLPPSTPGFGLTGPGSVPGPGCSGIPLNSGVPEFDAFFDSLSGQEQSDLIDCLDGLGLLDVDFSGAYIVTVGAGYCNPDTGQVYWVLSGPNGSTIDISNMCQAPNGQWYYGLCVWSTPFDDDPDNPIGPSPTALILPSGAPVKCYPESPGELGVIFTQIYPYE